MLFSAHQTTNEVCVSRKNVSRVIPVLPKDNIIALSKAKTLVPRSNCEHVAKVCLLLYQYAISVPHLNFRGMSTDDVSFPMTQTEHWSHCFDCVDALSCVDVPPPDCF